MQNLQISHSIRQFVHRSHGRLWRIMPRCSQDESSCLVTHNSRIPVCTSCKVAHNSPVISGVQLCENATTCQRRIRTGPEPMAAAHFRPVSGMTSCISRNKPQMVHHPAMLGCGSSSLSCHIPYRMFSSYIVEDDPEMKELLKLITSDFSTDKSSGDQYNSDESTVNPGKHKTSNEKSTAENTTEAGTSSSDSDSSDSSSSDDNSSSDSDDEGTDTSRRVFSQGNTSDIGAEDMSSDMKFESEDKPPEEDEYEEYYVEEEGIQEHVELIEERPLPISLKRGQHGVFDVEELVTLLESERARNLCVIRVPAEMQYVDQMVIVSGRTTRHLRAMAELVKWVYKRKRVTGDPQTCFIEGENTKDWMAIDLGNICLHLFLPETRALYDLETLWLVGAEFDEKVHEQPEQDPFAAYFSENFRAAQDGAPLRMNPKDLIHPLKGQTTDVVQPCQSSSDLWHRPPEEMWVQSAPPEKKSVQPALPEASKAVFNAPESSTAVFNAPESSTAVYNVPESSTAVFNAPESSKAVFNAPESSTAVFNAPESSTAVFNAPESSTAVFNAPESSTAVFNAPESNRALYNVPPEGSKEVYNAPVCSKAVFSAPEVSKAVYNAEGERNKFSQNITKNQLGKRTDEDKDS